ncbi:MAG TPA: TolC family protein [Blastocatellia bacterium]|jgi:cobalt-zinc-cadmium efflux system outer membrane protein|nr:TolC family protein [Blastocatellia bacterium]
MTNGKLRVGRFLGARAIRKDAVIFTLCAFLVVAPASQRLIIASPPQTEPALRLEDLERMALQNNPTVAQAEAAIRAAEGRRVQAGLMPNPIIGYLGEELNTRAFDQKSEHYIFAEQEVPLGGKLKKSRNVFAQERAQAQADAAAQKQRVLNAVRALYYEALGAQRLVETRGELAKLASEAVDVTGELFNTGAADLPDALQIQVEARRARLDLVMAENEREQIWRQIAAVVGDPFLKPARLDGDLEQGLPELELDQLVDALLRASPELKRAQAGIERARASLTRARAEPTPNLFLRGGMGYSTELLETFPPQPAGRRSGPEAFAEVGVRIPLFNRNQGAIAQAAAELDFAEREARRVELVLRARTASTFRAYQNALSVATEYRGQIVPRARQAYELYLASFKQMAAAYPQALIAQRTFFQTQTEYVRALVDVWRNAIQLQGFMLTGALDAPGGMPGDRGSRIED